jgi:hypothetical protein
MYQLNHGAYPVLVQIIIYHSLGIKSRRIIPMNRPFFSVIKFEDIYQTQTTTHTETAQKVQSTQQS